MKIVHYPHPALRHAAKPVTCIDKELHLNIGEMKELMYEAKGLGLAAPQVALPFQLLVMNITGDPKQARARRSLSQSASSSARGPSRTRKAA